MHVELNQLIHMLPVADSALSPLLSGSFGAALCLKVLGCNFATVKGALDSTDNMSARLSFASLLVSSYMLTDSQCLKALSH